MDILDTLVGEQTGPDFGNASEYQAAYYGALISGSDPIQLNARAGSGKTTTLVNGAKYLGGETLLLCFGKANKEELEARVKGSALAKTFNGQGSGLLWKYLRGAQLNANKVREATRSYMGEGSDLYHEYGTAVVRAISLMKNNAFGIYGQATVEPQNIAELISAYDLGVPEDKLSDISEIALRVFNLTNKDFSCYDFDDQLYIPIAMGWNFRPFTNVLVDEDQDLSPIQHIMLERLSEAGSRILGVGDDRQAIYGFRGALSNSVELLEKRFNMKRMPLPICYRCPKSVIKLAQVYVPDILWRPDAPEGEVLYRSESHSEDPEFFNPDVLVLSRTNAPLFKNVLHYVSHRRPCRVKSAFLETFQGFIRSFKTELCSDLRPKLREWFDKEKAAAERKGFKGRIAGLTDKYETADLLAREFKRTYEIIQLLDTLVASTSGTRFSTVHGAKGTEADDVYILRPDLLPSPFATTKEQMLQEENLLYVAITRARRSLTWGISHDKG